MTLETSRPDPVITQLTGPDGPFEIVVEDVARASRPRCTGSGCGRCGELRRAERRRAPTSPGSCRATGGSPSPSTTALVRGAARVRSRRSASSAATGSRSCSANCPEWVIMFWACALHRRDRGAAQRVVEDRGARVRALRFGRAGARRRHEALRARARPCSASLPALEHVFVIDGRRGRRRSARPFARAARRPGDPGMPDVAGRRGRHLRDPLHVGHDGPPEGRDDHAPPDPRQPAEHHRARRRAGDARHAAAGGRSRAAEPRRCSSCRCST